MLPKIPMLRCAAWFSGMLAAAMVQGQWTGIVGLQMGRMALFDPVQPIVARSTGLVCAMQGSRPASVKGTLQLNIARHAVQAENDYPLPLQERIEAWRSLEFLPGVKVYPVKDAFFIHVAAGVGLHRFNLKPLNLPVENHATYPASLQVVPLPAERARTSGIHLQAALGGETKQLELAGGASVALIRGREDYLPDGVEPYGEAAFFGGLESDLLWSIWLRLGMKL